MAASLVTSLTVQYAFGYDAADPTGIGFAVVMVWTVAVTTATWLIVTLLTRPEPDATLDAFYERVRPGGPGWRRVADRLGYGHERIPGGALAWANWVAGCAAVYGTLIGAGELLVGAPTRGVAWLAVAAAAFGLIARNLRSDKTLQRRAVDTTTGPP